jgi:hypothetical protein
MTRSNIQGTLGTNGVTERRPKDRYRRTGWPDKLESTSDRRYPLGGCTAPAQRDATVPPVEARGTAMH